MAIIAGVLLVLQFVTISTDVLLRVFGVSLDWVIYMNEWSLLFVSFLCLAWLQKEDGHVRMDIIFSVLPPLVQRVILLATAISIALCSALLTWYSTQVTWQLYESNAYDFFKVDYVPLYLIYAIMPIGFFLLLLQTLLEIGDCIRALVRESSVAR